MAVAISSPTSSAAASSHTTRQKSFSPETSKGRMAPALATMPVPITEAYQLGPKYLEVDRPGSGDERTSAATCSLLMALLC